MTRREVRETYDRIAPHFARTRPHPWSEVEAFLEGRSGGRGLDIGVGNGRHAELLARLCPIVIGLDVSRIALGEAINRADDRAFVISTVQADASILPLDRNCVDLSVYVATLHHLPSRRLRIRSLNELCRVLTSTGRAIIGVWSVTHERFDGDSGFDTTIKWTLPHGDVVDRFYHIYDGEEFRRDIDAAGLRRFQTFESHGNWYAIVGPEQ